MERDITFREFEGINSFSNANIERVLRSYINESANAALVSVFDDGVILYNVNEGVFHKADYSFNKENLSVVMKNFSRINLKEDEKVNFKMAVKDYFIGESTDMSTLADNYVEFMEKPKVAVERLVSESIADKSFENTADFEELSYINEGFKDLHNEEFFKSYQKRAITNPLSDVLVFNFRDPVAFSLYESTEPVQYINSQGKKKALQLTKNKNFKKKVMVASNIFKEDVEEGELALFALFEEFPSLFYLTETELRETFARILITDPKRQGDYKSILEGVKLFVANDPDIAYLKESVMGEAIDIGSEEGDDEVKDLNQKEPKGDGSDEKDDEDKEPEEEKAKELTTAEKTKLVDALKTVVDKAVDEKIKDMAQELLAKFKDDKDDDKDDKAKDSDKDDKDEFDDEGTRPDDVKEAVRFLSIAI